MVVVKVEKETDERFLNKQVRHNSRQVLSREDLHCNRVYRILHMQDNGEIVYCGLIDRLEFIDSRNEWIQARYYFDRGLMRGEVFTRYFSLMDLGVIPYGNLIDIESGKNLKGKWNARNWLEENG